MRHMYVYQCNQVRCLAAIWLSVFQGLDMGHLV